MRLVQHFMEGEATAPKLLLMLKILEAEVLCAAFFFCLMNSEESKRETGETVHSCYKLRELVLPMFCNNKCN